MAECRVAADHHGGERVRDGIPGRGVSSRLAADPQRIRPESTLARTRTDRKRAYEAGRIDRHCSGHLEGLRGAGRSRRFWHGLLELELLAKVSHRFLEDRP